MHLRHVEQRRCLVAALNVYKQSWWRKRDDPLLHVMSNFILHPPQPTIIIVRCGIHRSVLAGAHQIPPPIYYRCSQHHLKVSASYSEMQQSNAMTLFPLVLAAAVRKVKILSLKRINFTPVCIHLFIVAHFVFYLNKRWTMNICTQQTASMWRLEFEFYNDE